MVGWCMQDPLLGSQGQGHKNINIFSSQMTKSNLIVETHIYGLKDCLWNIIYEKLVRDSKT